MPFEISPKFAPVETKPEVGRFQKFADALLDGCQQTLPLRHGMFRPGARFLGWQIKRPAACALGALRRGLGMSPGFDDYDFQIETMAMRRAYVRMYGKSIAIDNDSGAYTREQIAARIAAL